MVLKVPQASEEFYQNDRASIDDSECTLIETISVEGYEDEELGIYKSPLKEGNELGGIGYWVGIQNDHDENTIIAFFIVKPLTLENLSGITGLRGYVHPEIRKKGIYRKLRVAASDGGPLISDLAGQTEDSFLSWMKDPHFSKQFYDYNSGRLVDPSNVPEDEQHTEYSQGSRWLLVLTPI